MPQISPERTIPSYRLDPLSWRCPEQLDKGELASSLMGGVVAVSVALDLTRDQEVECVDFADFHNEIVTMLRALELPLHVHSLDPRDSKTGCFALDHLHEIYSRIAEIQIPQTPSEGDLPLIKIIERARNRLDRPHWLPDSPQLIVDESAHVSGCVIDEVSCCGGLKIDEEAISIAAEVIAEMMDVKARDVCAALILYSTAAMVLSNSRESSSIIARA